MEQIFDWSLINHWSEVPILSCWVKTQNKRVLLNFIRENRISTRAWQVCFHKSRVFPRIKQPKAVNLACWIIHLAPAGVNYHNLIFLRAWADSVLLAVVCAKLRKNGRAINTVARSCKTSASPQGRRAAATSLALMLIYGDEIWNRRGGAEMGSMHLRSSLFLCAFPGGPLHRLQWGYSTYASDLTEAFLNLRTSPRTRMQINWMRRYCD